MTDTKRTVGDIIQEIEDLAQRLLTNKRISEESRVKCLNQIVKDTAELAGRKAISRVVLETE